MMEEACEMKNDTDNYKKQHKESKVERDGSKRMLFEMHISGFFNDLPPLESEDSGQYQVVGHNPAVNKTAASSGWSLSQLLGFPAAASASSKPLLPPSWSFR